MRMDRYLGPIESHVAATNLNLIKSDYERLYNENCPAGLLDVTELSDRYLSPLETQRAAMNLNSIARSAKVSAISIISIIAYTWMLIIVLGWVLVWLGIL